MIQRIRQQHPQYEDMTDSELMNAIYQKHYADMPRDQFDRACGMPNHEDLQNCAVRGHDSLDLQNLDPSVKPAVKMTFEEYPGPQADKITVILGDGTTYIIANGTVDPTDALTAILTGNDSELLGYPAKGDEHAVVTKQGNIISSIPEMKQHATAGNIAWAANGNGPELMQKAENVSHVIVNR